jgi:two-component system sensor kinase FixL
MEPPADSRGCHLDRENLGVSAPEASAAAPDMLIRTMDGRVTFWPPGMEQRYGFTSAQALGHTSHQLLKTLFPHALNEIEATLQHQGNWSGGSIHRHADGRPIVVIGHWYLQRAADGRDAAITEIHSDAVCRQFADLIAMLAHELSEPMTAISNYMNAAQSILDRAWPDRDSLRYAVAQTIIQIARSAEGVKLMRDLVSQLRSTD